MRRQLAVKTKILPFRELLESTPDAMVIVNEAGENRPHQFSDRKTVRIRPRGPAWSSVERLIPARFQDRHLDHTAAYFSDPRLRALGYREETF